MDKSNFTDKLSAVIFLKHFLKTSYYGFMSSRDKKLNGMSVKNYPCFYDIYTLKILGETRKKKWVKVIPIFIKNKSVNSFPLVSCAV